MTFEEIATSVRHVICEHFAIPVTLLIDGAYLWDDLNADDLDFVEIFMALEERLNSPYLDCINIESYRVLTVIQLIEHINLTLNPILQEAQ